MPIMGKLEEFDLSTDTVSLYVECTKLFFAANSITAERQVLIFLNVIGKTNYQLLRNLLSPSTPGDKSFSELVDTLKGHFEPKPLVISERSNFHPGEERNGSAVCS